MKKHYASVPFSPFSLGGKGGCDGHGGARRGGLWKARAWSMSVPFQVRNSVSPELAEILLRGLAGG